MPFLIEALGVSKTFRHWRSRVPALHTITLRVAAGEIVGLVGPNGAGKSTLLQLLLGYLHADNGSMTVCGRLPGDPLGRKTLGWVPEQPLLFPWMTGRRFVEAALAEHGWRQAERQRRAAELFEAFEMGAAMDRRLSTYSRGMQQKTALLHALAHQPSCLILDEPISGMDPGAIVMVRETLRRFRAQGGAVLISSHQLAELLRLCDRAVFIHRGVVEREVGMDPALVRRRVSVRVEDPASLPAVVNGPWTFAGTPAVMGELLQVELREGAVVADLVAYLVSQDVRIRSVGESGEDLEAHFMEMTKIPVETSDEIPGANSGGNPGGRE